jgi:hypothetical protein
MLAPNIDYRSENIKEVVNTLSVIQRRCIITKYIFADHDDYSHLYKHDALLHINFDDNNFYDSPV